MEDSLRIDLESIRRLIADVSIKTSELLRSESNSINDKCEVLIFLNDIKRDAGMAYDESMNMLAEKMEDSIVYMPDGTEVERKQSADRKAWDHKGLAVEVAGKISQLATDMDTGEIVLTPEEMMIKMLDYAAPSYWRVGELGKIGVNPDSYCEKSEGKTSIIIKKGKL